MAGSCILSRQRNATHHVLLRDSLRNDNDKGDLVLDCIDGCRHGKWRRHVDDRRIRLHRCFRLLHGVENGQTDVCSASLLGRDAPDHIGAISDGLLTVKRALRAGKALADYTRVLVHCRRRTRTHEARLGRPLGRRPGNVAKSAHSRMHPATHNTKPRAGHIRLFRAMQTAARPQTHTPSGRTKSQHEIDQDTKRGDSTNGTASANVPQNQRSRRCDFPRSARATRLQGRVGSTPPRSRLIPLLMMFTASWVASEASRCGNQWKAHGRTNSIPTPQSQKLEQYAGEDTSASGPEQQNDGRHG